ncbi:MULTISPECIES: hypothetical protein [Gammaproteobacteria]|uniref:hypothetical protein n=1 Tax=Gammaproteobacteria TaxID=1236 RepID=UPI003A91E07D
MKKLLLITGLSFFLCACGDSKPPVKIDAFSMPGFFDGTHFPKVQVIAIDDDVLIEDISINRGNCKAINRYKPLPAHLKYGESITVTSTVDCLLSEVSVVANGDNWSVSY